MFRNRLLRSRTAPSRVMARTVPVAAVMAVVAPPAWALTRGQPAPGQSATAAPRRLRWRLHAIRSRDAPLVLCTKRARACCRAARNRPRGSTGWQPIKETRLDRLIWQPCCRRAQAGTRGTIKRGQAALPIGLRVLVDGLPVAPAKAGQNDRRATSQWTDAERNTPKL